MTEPRTPTDTDDVLPADEDRTAEGAAEDEGPDVIESWPADDEEDE